MAKTRIFSCLLGFLPFLACQPAVHYTGKSYPATQKVDFFSSRGQIKKPFLVFGVTDQNAYSFSRFEKIKAKIMALARKRGADAVLLSDTELHDNNLSENINVISPDRQTGDADPQIPPVNGPVEKSVRYLRAEFLKYK